MERWPSGLRRMLGKCVYPHGYPGFESLSLRHNLLLYNPYKWYDIYESNKGDKMEVAIVLGLAWWAWSTFAN